MVGDEPRLVRSYQRIFRPDRRVYAIDGRTLPIPGGVPLRWLGWALGALIAVMTLAAGNRLVWLAAAGLAAATAVRAGRRRAAPAVAIVAVSGCVVIGAVLGLLDWPLRLIVLPALVATIATQLTPDGRAAHRFAASWLWARLAGRRRLGHPLPQRDGAAIAVRVRVAWDSHHHRLRRGRVQGAATVRFTAPVMARRHRGGLVVRPLHARGRRAAAGIMVQEVRLEDGERLEVRP